MAATPQIIVHASLPLNVAHNAELDLHPSNWHWVHCLTLPLEKLRALRFLHRPYKWIRYAIGVVIGAEGDLSSSSDLPDVVDYNADLPTDTVVLYYHTNNEEKRRMFPIDPDIFRTQVTSSVSSTRRGTFRDDVIERDGPRCVWLGYDADLCDAVHLLAHTKGDKYISNFTHRRSRCNNESDIITEIDDVRNGIFLNKHAHSLLGKDLAFLVTPNFAMDTADVDHTAPPEQKRCTAHIFRLNGHFSPDFASGSSLQISEGPQFPPDILFDGVYAGVVLYHFGTESAKVGIARDWRDIMYPGGVMAASHEEHTITAEKRWAQVQERNARHERHARRHGPDTFDMLMALPYILVPQNVRQANIRAAIEEAEAADQAEQRRVHERVEGWIRQVDAG